MCRSTTVASPSHRPPPAARRVAPAVRSGFLSRAAVRRQLGRGANDNRMPPARRLRVAIGTAAVLAMLAGLIYLSAAPPIAPS